MVQKAVKSAAKAALKQVTARSVHAARAYRTYLRQKQAGFFPDWDALLATDPGLWAEAREKATNGPTVLLATSTGGLPTPVILDGMLAAALTLRGANVHLLLCDELLPGCLMAEIGLIRPDELERKGPQAYNCAHCFRPGHAVLSKLGLPLHTYSQYVTPEESARAAEIAAQTPFAEIDDYVLEGIPVGEHATAGALRYFARSNIEGVPHAAAITRRYFRAALLTAFGMRRLIRQTGAEVVSGINGIYVPQGVVAATARSENARVVAWNVAYRKSAFIFSHGDTYHHTLMSEPTADWEDMEWSDEHERRIMEYLNSRRTAARDWIAFQVKNPNEDIAAIAHTLGGIDFNKPTIGLLTNVAWDAQLHYPANAFGDMIEWIVKTVAYFKDRPDLNLVIRVHPAELSGDVPSRQPVVAELNKQFPTLPSNVYVVGPESPISTYALMEACDSAIVYGTKTGVELTSRGIPVVVAGEAWIRNKGVTVDASSETHYFEILDRLPFRAPMPEEQVSRARKYAYHFFFRRMIPVDQVAPTGREPKFQVAIDTLADLLPGKSKGLDVICDGILNGTPFIFPAEVSEKVEKAKVLV